MCWSDYGVSATRDAEQPDREDHAAMNDVDKTKTEWAIDPAMVMRLWPVIDVYGRIAQAQRAPSASEARLLHNDSAA